MEPGPRDIEKHVLELRRRHPRMATVDEVGRSSQGRPILAVTVTDPDSPDDDKQHALIVAGQHGEEETARATALALLDWLVSPAAAATRRRQKIAVMPCVNPDGAEADSHLTAAGIAPNLDHGPGGARSPEGIAVEKVAYELEPELFIDMHARGFAGCSYDMVLYPATLPYTEDDNLFHALAADMARAGEAAGIPHMTHPLTWPGWGGDDPAEPSTTLFAYRRFKSMVMLTESSESNACAYPMSMRVKAGLARLRCALAWGNRRHPRLAHGGYPCSLVAGMFLSGIVAVGATAAGRRRSRIEAWRNRAGFAKLDRRIPEEDRVKRLTLHYTGPALAQPVGIQSFAAGRLKVVSVMLDGQPADAIARTWHDRCATLTVVPVERLQPGEHELEIRHA